MRAITRGQLCADGPDYVRWKYAVIYSVGKTYACACVSMCVFVFGCRCVCLHKCIHTLGTQTVKDDFQLLVGGPTPNTALFKELVAPPPPGDFGLMVTVCYQVIL